MAKVVAHGKKSARAMQRARILFLFDAARPEKALTTLLGVSRGTLDNVRKKYRHQEYEPLLDVLHEAPRSGRPIQIDPRVEAKVPMLAGRDPPAGYGRWTLPTSADQLGQ